MALTNLWLYFKHDDKARVIRIHCGRCDWTSEPIPRWQVGKGKVVAEAFKHLSAEHSESVE